MKSRYFGFGRLAPAGALWLIGSSLAPSLSWADQVVGQPVDKGIGFQPEASQIRADVIGFHNHILMPVITAITLLVLVLLILVIVRYNKRSNPEPARFSHNTLVEMIWTVTPILILAFIAIFSFRLLYEEHDMPRPYMTVKVTARQWNWDYAYPDQKIEAFTSVPLEEADANAKHLPYLLAVDNPMVAPVGKVVRVEVTAEDVIHSFSVPAFGIKMDAVPGRLNETWFKADKVGTFYGQCSQLCGINHSYMPIMVRVVSQADFDAWVAQHAPKPAAAPPASQPASAVGQKAPPPAGAPEPAAQATPTAPAAAKT